MKHSRKPIQYGIIGAGIRAEQVIRHLDSFNDGVFLKAVCDTCPDRAEVFKNKYGSSDTTIYTNYKKLLNDKTISWVFVFSPNHLHKEHIISSFEAGKHVFGEKPLATTIDDCVAIKNAHENSENLIFATGFVLRYAPIYRKAKEIIDSGFIGKVITIEANENVSAEHGGHIMTCWRRNKELSGSHILEKCCHDMDLINWLIGSLPCKVASFGGLDIFTEENKENLTKFKPYPEKSSIYLSWDVPSRDSQDPFKSEKSIIDNQVAILEYRNHVRVTFQTTLNNAIPERRMYICGTEGSMIIELYSGQLTVKRIGFETESEDFKYTPDMHGGGDIIIAEHMLKTMKDEVAPLCSGEEGLLSAVVSLSLEEARIQDRIIDMEPIWKKLSR